MMDNLSNHIGDTFDIRVTPKAAANKIKIERAEKNDVALIRVYVTCAPEDGKANKAVIALLSKELGIPKSRLVMTSGEKSRNKRIQIRAN